jgi:hypothetical protein
VYLAFPLHGSYLYDPNSDSDYDLVTSSLGITTGVSDPDASSSLLLAGSFSASSALVHQVLTMFNESNPLVSISEQNLGLQFALITCVLVVGTVAFPSTSITPSTFISLSSPYHFPN